ncbi:hypothetical protein BMS89_08760 [Leuconostoc pseudomesenteroides]|nr:hypothetical protein BMS89_08760 [Leuconostoc pseudomesenteroides]
MDQCETNENTQLAITTKGFSAVCSVRLILAIYHKSKVATQSILSGENGDSSWTLDDTTGELIFTNGTLDQNIATNITNEGYDPTLVKSVSFQGTVVAPTNLDNFLTGLTELQSFDGANLDTSSVTSMRNFFSGLSKLGKVNLDIATNHTMSGTCMENFFANTPSLWKIAIGANFEFQGDTPVTIPSAPDVGTHITDNGTTYVTSAANWQLVGAGTDHLPAGEVLSNLKTITTNTAPRPLTIVWAQTGETYDPILRGYHGTSPWTLDPDTGELIYGSGTFQDALTVVANLESYDVDPDIVTSISFTGTVNLPANATSMFSGLDNLTAFDATNSYTDNVTNMKSMFQGTIITNLDLSSWKVTQVMSFYNMFSNAKQLMTLNLSDWGVGRTATNVTMYGMFDHTSALTNLTLTNFKTTNVTDMGVMFYYSGVKSLDLSDWDVTQVTSFYFMFTYSQLVTLNLSSWDIGHTATNVSMRYMFAFTSQLKTLNLTNFKVTNIIDLSETFRGTGLESLDVSGWDVSKVTTFSMTFAQAWDIKSLNVSGWGVGRTATNVSMSNMFFGLGRLNDLNLTNFKTTNVTNMSYMFADNSDSVKIPITSLDVSGFDVTQVTTFTKMFANISQLRTLDLSSWTTSGATATNMFAGTSSLWKITLGENVQFAADPSFTAAPAVGTTIPGTSYVTTAASWQNIGTGTDHQPAGALVTTTEMYADRTEPVTYVWAQGVQPTPAINTISSLNFGTLAASDFFNGNSPLATNMATGSVALKDLDNSTTYNVTVAQTSDWTTDGESAKIAKSNLKIKYGTSDLATGASSFWSGTSATETKSIAFNHDTTKNFSIWLNPSTVLNTALLGKQLESELTWTLSETP